MFCPRVLRPGALIAAGLLVTGCEPLLSDDRPPSPVIASVLGPVYLAELHDPGDRTTPEQSRADQRLRSARRAERAARGRAEIQRRAAGFASELPPAHKAAQRTRRIATKQARRKARLPAGQDQPGASPIMGDPDPGHLATPRDGR